MIIKNKIFQIIFMFLLFIVGVIPCNHPDMGENMVSPLQVINCFAQQEESITISTYYPAPDGLYKDLYFTGKFARHENKDAMYGDNAGTHVSLGVSLAGNGGKTGISGQNISYCTISGGLNNNATGEGSTVSGGAFNRAGGNYSTVSGGGKEIFGGLDWPGNRATGDYATISGGIDNYVTGLGSTIGGGVQNEVQGQCSVIIGGSAQNIPNSNQASSDYSTIGGGSENSIVASYSTIGGGDKNSIEAQYSTIGGGASNKALGDYSTIGGGANNEARQQYGAICGGWGNKAWGNYASIGGGTDNIISIANYSTILGGSNGLVNDGADYTTFCGGEGNKVHFKDYATVVGGQNNLISGEYATIIGGEANRADGDYSVICGGSNNVTKGQYSFAAGRNAQALHSYCFVWGGVNTFLDSPVYASTDICQFRARTEGVWIETGRSTGASAIVYLRADRDKDAQFNLYALDAGNRESGFQLHYNANVNSFDIEARNGTNSLTCLMSNGFVGINKANPTVPLDVNGRVWCTDKVERSDLRLKTNIVPLAGVLDKVDRIKVVSFNWIDDHKRDIGVIAQDVEKVFPDLVLKSDSYGIKDARSVNYSGLGAVLLQGVKELYLKLNDLKKDYLVSSGQAELKDGIAEINLGNDITINNNIIQFTCIDGYSPLFIKSKIQNNRFIVVTTKDGNPNQKFYWQIKRVYQ